MIVLQKYLKQSATYKLFVQFLVVFADFLETLGRISQLGFHTLKCILKGEIELKELISQCDRFGVSSLPITLSIVGMTSIIVASQVANEMVKQGGGNFVGMLMTILIVREVGAIMSGFALTSMIGSSLASEIATMRVTEQVDAIEVLQVDPVRYLFVPRVLSGAIMMPFVVILATTFGILAGGLISMMSAKDVTWLCYVTSVWQGLYIRDINIMLFKAACFGGAISLISSSCGYDAKGGAKGVGIATTKAVVWSFVAIVIIDCIFAVAFYF